MGYRQWSLRGESGRDVTKLPLPCVLTPCQSIESVKFWQVMLADVYVVSPRLEILKQQDLSIANTLVA
jgi:hypothetical protein